MSPPGEGSGHARRHLSSAAEAFDWPERCPLRARFAHANAFLDTGEMPFPRDRPVFWLPDPPTAEPSQPPWASGLHSTVVPGHSDGLAPDSHRLPEHLSRKRAVLPLAYRHARGQPRLTRGCAGDSDECVPVPVRGFQREGRENRPRSRHCDGGCSAEHATRHCRGRLGASAGPQSQETCRSE